MTDSAPVFSGVKVLELGAGAAGPIATRYLADHGATVVKLESRKRPDFLRTVHLTKDNPHGLDGSPMYVLCNPNKLSATINLSKPEGVELVKRLVGWADVVAENFSPKAMANWGLGYENLRAIKPELIVVSNCLFGQTGPQRMYPGFGGQGSAISGFNHVTGWPDREAIGPHGTITDSLAPRYVALLIAAALLDRRRTGRGRYIDVSQIECGVYSLSEMIVRRSARGENVTRRGNHAESAAPHSIYPCAGSDRWIAIAVGSDAEWEALVGVMGNPAWAKEPRFAQAQSRLAHQEELDDEIGDWTRGIDPYTLMQQLQEAGVEAGVVQNFQDLLDDPQLAHRKHYETLEHANLGPCPFEQYSIRLAESPPQLRTPGPNLGEHNEQIFGEFLGMDSEEISRLMKEEIIA